jgi:ribose/xylose/arabinose/galactoside ABC-type transport system permease subunit
MTASAKPATARARLDIGRLWARFGIAFVVVALWAAGAMFVHNFASADNLTSILRQCSFVGIAAIGMTMAIIAGLFDLSVGSTMALAAWAAVLTASATGNPFAALLVAVAIGALVGAVNGFFVTIVLIPAFITTLGMLFIVAGVHLVLTDGGAARYSGPDFIWWGNGSVGPVPVPVVVFLACAVAGSVILQLTSFGRYLFAIGSNAPAAHVAGVPIRAATFGVFVAVGVFTGISAMLLGARLYSAGPGLDSGFNLNVIATVVLGGTPLAGGRGTIVGTVAAAILFTTLNNLLNLLQIDPFLQGIAVGLVLVSALSIEGVRQRLAERVGSE